MLSETAYGTPPRKEREYKFAIKGWNGSLPELSILAGEALNKGVLELERWQAPKYSRGNFWVTGESDPVIYRDIYLDTEDGLTYRNDISYRLRNRFKDQRTHLRHIKNPEQPGFWPYRLEFQSKTSRKRLSEPSLSEVIEARLEFRKQSQPFNGELNLPPPPPWPLAEYLPWMESGYFRGRLGTAAQEVVRQLVAVNPDRKEFRFLPKSAVVSGRSRFHLNIESQWGSGPNPAQSYIITFDDALVYPAEDYLKLIQEGPELSNSEISHRLQSPYRIVELEIEFERNVSDQLYRDPNAPAGAVSAFEHDQREIVRVLQDHLADQGIQVISQARSKYIQAIDLLKGER
jgi:hypothetical protein